MAIQPSDRFGPFEYETSSLFRSPLYIEIMDYGKQFQWIDKGCQILIKILKKIVTNILKIEKGQNIRRDNMNTTK